MYLFSGTVFAKRLQVAAAGIALAAMMFAGVAVGDTLELKDGQVIEGKFLDGSPLNIRFRVDGKIRTFATKDVLNIGFSDSEPESNTATAPARAGAAPAQTAKASAVAQSEPSATAASKPSVAEASRQSVPSLSSAPPVTGVPASPAPLNGPGTHPVTIPAGTSLLVRMIDSVDSSTNSLGDPFQASLEGPLAVDNTVIAPKGADVYGKLAQVRAAGQLSGASQLTLELTGIRINGKTVPIDSTDYDVAGASRGKQSAERIGGGAVLGAVIGAIAGGGKGAAVGAAVGGGAGTAAQVLTHGQQVRVPSETLLEFKLQQPVTLQIPN